MMDVLPLKGGRESIRSGHVNVYPIRSFMYLEKLYHGESYEQQYRVFE